MSLTRHQLREMAFQVLYSLEMNPDANRELVYQQLAEGKHDAYVDEIIDGVLSHRSDYDAQIEPHLDKSWSLKRLDRTDRLILYIALYEMNERIDIPNKVAINEALQFAKKFSDETHAKFINAILGKITAD